MNIPPQLQALYQQYQQAQGQGGQGSPMLQGAKDPMKLAQALMQFQNPNSVDPEAQKYGIQPGLSMI